MGNSIKAQLSVATSLLGVSRGGIILFVVVLVSIASIWFLISWKRNGGHIEPLSQDEIDRHLARRERRNKEYKSDTKKYTKAEKQGVLVLKKHKGEDDEQ